MADVPKPDLQTDDLENLKTFATAFIENIHSSRLAPDAFEFYAQRVQSSVFADQQHFETRFIAGYQALLKELSTLK